MSLLALTSTDFRIQLKHVYHRQHPQRPGDEPTPARQSPDKGAHDEHTDIYDAAQATEKPQVKMILRLNNTTNAMD
jgi:hypothetical protein